MEVGGGGGGGGGGVREIMLREGGVSGGTNQKRTEIRRY